MPAGEERNFRGLSRMSRARQDVGMRRGERGGFFDGEDVAVVFAAVGNGVGDFFDDKDAQAADGAVGGGEGRVGVGVGEGVVGDAVIGNGQAGVGRGNFGVDFEGGCAGMFHDVGGDFVEHDMQGGGEEGGGGEAFVQKGGGGG